VRAPPAVIFVVPVVVRLARVIDVPALSVSAPAVLTPVVSELASVIDTVPLVLNVSVPTKSLLALVRRIPFAPAERVVAPPTDIAPDWVIPPPAPVAVTVALPDVLNNENSTIPVVELMTMTPPPPVKTLKRAP